MVICNIVVPEDFEWDSEDGKLVAKHKLCPAINVVDDLTHIHTGVPTLFYSNKLAKKLWSDTIPARARKLNRFYWYTYALSEVPYENWIDEFVADAAKDYFQYVSNGIDVVFEDFNMVEFVSHLNPYPLIHEGGYEIYIADWRDREIIIHSIKKDTLEYIGIKPKEFLTQMYELLDYDFLSIEANRYDLRSKLNNKIPVFLDDLLFANSDQWFGIDEIIDYYSVIEIDRPKVITFYLRQSEYLRQKFELYR